MSAQKMLAAVDLGSNSFRMMIGRVEETEVGSRICQVDAMREPVRLAAGLTPDKYLDKTAHQRGLDALKRFGERLRSFDTASVRAVATNTLRVARNASDFLSAGEIALGFPIEVIGGREEARLIYIGASHEAPPCQDKRLVVDIGGGSTEFIIGEQYTPRQMESLYIGCVAYSRQFFPNGEIDEYAMRQATLAARREIQIIAETYRRAGWAQAVGSSGMARALAELIELNNLDVRSAQGHGITRDGLEKLKRVLIKAENVNTVQLEGLKADRVAVLPGGLAIMLGVFNELDIDYMEVTDGALRLGVLYDLLGRAHEADVRTVTVERFMHRYHIDTQQAQRVGKLAKSLLVQFPEPGNGQRANNLALLKWAASLHEIGLSIAHGGYHKHSAYIASHADMPGFSHTDQNRLAALLLGHAGKLGKLSGSGKFMDWRMLFCLRLALLLCRGRTDEPLPEIRIFELEDGYQVALPKGWLAHHSLVEYSLQREAAEWQRIGRRYRIMTVD